MIERNTKFLIAIIFTILFAGAAIAVAMDQVAKEKVYSWRYKITVNIDTPEGVKSGSAVRQVEITQKDITPPDGQPGGKNYVPGKKNYTTKFKVFGEAVVVDLGKRGTVFALIEDGAYAHVLRAFNIKKFEDAERLTAGSKAQLNCDEHVYCPKIVTFKNIEDPQSVRLVYVNKTYADRTKEQVDNFEDLFGESVNLKDIQIEATNSTPQW